jgi:hypothetical protein
MQILEVTMRGDGIYAHQGFHVLRDEDKLLLESMELSTLGKRECKFILSGS